MLTVLWKKCWENSWFNEWLLIRQLIIQSRSSKIDGIKKRLQNTSKCKTEFSTGLVIEVALLTIIIVINQSLFLPLYYSLVRYYCVQSCKNILYSVNIEIFRRYKATSFYLFTKQYADPLKQCLYFFIPHHLGKIAHLEMFQLIYLKCIEQVNCT